MKKGQTNNPHGRPKGVKNKTTTSVKEALVKAFEKLGGVKALAEWAETEKTEFYKIYSRLLPKDIEVTGANGGPIQTSVEVKFIGPGSKSHG